MKFTKKEEEEEERRRRKKVEVKWDKTNITKIRISKLYEMFLCIPPCFRPMRKNSQKEDKDGRKLKDKGGLQTNHANRLLFYYMTMFFDICLLNFLIVLLYFFWYYLTMAFVSLFETFESSNHLIRDLYKWNKSN